LDLARIAKDIQSALKQVANFRASVLPELSRAVFGKVSANEAMLNLLMSVGQRSIHNKPVSPEEDITINKENQFATKRSLALTPRTRSDRVRELLASLQPKSL
jgi:hypothetical protein